MSDPETPATPQDHEPVDVQDVTALFARFAEANEKTVAKIRAAMKAVDPMAMYLASQPGTNVVGGGRKTREAAQLRSAYARHKRKNQKRDPHWKMGRYTPPKDQANG